MRASIILHARKTTARALHLLTSVKSIVEFLFYFFIVITLEMFHYFYLYQVLVVIFILIVVLWYLGDFLLADVARIFGTARILAIEEVGGIAFKGKVVETTEGAPLNLLFL